MLIVSQMPTHPPQHSEPVIIAATRNRLAIGVGYGWIELEFRCVFLIRLFLLMLILFHVLRHFHLKQQALYDPPSDYLS